MTFDPKDYPNTIKILKEKLKDRVIETAEEIEKAHHDLNVPVEFIEYVVKEQKKVLK